jgi:dimethylglycine dehydrogenase
LVGRVSYTGDLGYEIWVRPEYQRRLFTDILEVGAEFDIKLFGSRALNALRLEKNFGSWGREFRPVYYPHETGLDSFCAFSKDADFIGKEAAVTARDNGGGAYRLRSFVIEASNADVIGDEPLFYNGEVAGFVTSGGFAHASDMSVAMGYVRAELADEQDGWSVELFAEMLDARMQKQPLFDSNSSRMRS